MREGFFLSWNMYLSGLMVKTATPPSPPSRSFSATDDLEEKEGFN